MNTCHSCGELAPEDAPYCADCLREMAEKREDEYAFRQYTQARLDCSWGEWAEGNQRTLWEE